MDFGDSHLFRISGLSGFWYYHYPSISLELSPIAYIAKRTFLRFSELEDKSKDTFENAKYSIEICEKRGFTLPILLTSAFHLKRSYWVFEHLGMNINPFPAYFKTHDNPSYHWNSFLPNRNSLVSTSNALHEYLGLIFYKIYYWPLLFVLSSFRYPRRYLFWESEYLNILI